MLNLERSGKVMYYKVESHNGILQSKGIMELRFI